MQIIQNSVMKENNLTLVPSDFGLKKIEMETLKFTIIKSKVQYDHYCAILEDLIAQDDKKVQDEIDLLTLLIEHWDREHNTISDSDPIEILKSLMTEHNLKAKDLINILNLSKGTISKVLNYHKGLSN